MKRFMTGACWPAAPKVLGSVLTGLLACAWTFGIAPQSAHAQYSSGYGQSPQTGYGQSPQTRREPSTRGASFFGIPMEHGRVRWPVGLWLLVSDEAEGSRDQLELAMNFAARQAERGKVNPVAIALGLDSVHDLRRELRSNKRMMSRISYAEAVRFLDRAERGLTTMKKLDASLRSDSPDKGTADDKVAPRLRGERRRSSEDE